MRATEPHRTAVDAAFARWVPGHALPQAFYTDESIYRADLEAVWFRHWIWVGHSSQLAGAGDFLRFDVDRESVLVVRGQDGELRAFANVCPHRGSRVCLDHGGKASGFTCPYHAWRFNLSGELLSRRAMPADFAPTEHGLTRLPLLEFQGLLFVSFSDDPPPLAAALAPIASLCEPFDFRALKVAHSAVYPVEANWKLALENYLECYHCAPSHRDYARSHSLKDPVSVAQLAPSLAARSAAVGVPTREHSACGTDATHPACSVYYRRYPLYDGFETGSETGASVAPTLGTLTGRDGGATDLQTGVLNNFLVYSDHMVGYRFIPTGPDTTDIHTVWLVNADAVAGVDYDLDALCWLWHRTTLDDERIIRHNQAGVRSRFYRPGPLSDMEWGIVDFYAGYFGDLGLTSW
ncbi:MAG: aromatic ring-hydroxylating dioxygenase subunit alpha [Pseudomonadota bacterium]